MPVIKLNFKTLFTTPVERLFGPYNSLSDEVKSKYINTVDFIRYQLKDA
jgi:hypothetical protein